MDLSHVLAAVVAGLAAGAVNAIAGGGSLITFPTLIATGLPSVAANVTNSVVGLPRLRRRASSAAGPICVGQGRRLRAIVPTSVRRVGGRLRAAAAHAGAGVRAGGAVPGARRGGDAGLPGAAARPGRASAGACRRAGPAITLQVVVFVGAVYGGYFGAALGVMYVAALALILDEPLNRINALKNVLSAAVGLVTVVVFAIFAPVALGCGAHAGAGHDHRRVRGRPARPPAAGPGPAHRDRHLRHGDRPVPAVPRVPLTAAVGDQARSAGSVLAPQSRTTTRSPGGGQVGAGGQRRVRGRGAVLDDDAVVVPQSPAGVDDRLVVDQQRRHPGGGRLARTRSGPTRRAPSESAATPETGTSTGPPARSAVVQGGGGRRLDRDDRAPRSRRAAITPAIRPPPPTATSTVSKPSGIWSSSSRPSVPLPATMSGSS